MNPNAAKLYYRPRFQPTNRRGVAWASVIAVLFVAIATISFAVDQTVTLSSVPATAAPPTAAPREHAITR